MALVKLFALQKIVKMHNKVRVILPKWIWDNATNNDEFKANLSKYMQRYPRYRVTKVDRYYAICEMR